MRPVYPFDLDQAARALMCHAPADRTHAMEELLRRADTADRFRKALGRAHPTFGSGTLVSAIQGPVEQVTRCDAAYLASLQVVVARLLARRCHHKL